MKGNNSKIFFSTHFLLLLFLTTFIVSNSHANEDDASIRYKTLKTEMEFFNNKTSVNERSDTLNNNEEKTPFKTQEIEYAQLKAHESAQSPQAGLITRSSGSAWNLVIGVLIIGLIIYGALHKFK